MFRSIVCVGFIFFSLGGWGCSSPPCIRTSVDVTYNYFTTCAGIANEKTGQIRWQIPQQAQSELEVHNSLREQNRKQGLYVDSMSLVWERRTCDSDKQPIPYKGLERIVFSPDTGDTGTVQILLVCQQSGGAAPLNENILLACRRGQQKSIRCTLQLKLAK